MNQVVSFLESRVDAGDFSAWSFASNDGICSGFWADEGASSLEPMIESERIHPRFDLASLTKPLLQNALIRELFKDNYEALDQPVTEILEVKSWLVELFREKFSGPILRLTLRDFLNHRTGFRPWIWFGGSPADAARERSIVGRILSTHTGDSSLAPVNYSDLNYFLLARFCEHLPEVFGSADWRKNLSRLNELLGSDFTHASLVDEMYHSAVPSFPYFSMDMVASGNADEYPLFGVVHDTNANILCESQRGAKKIVSGHAGLFGSAVDVWKGVNFLARTQARFASSTFESPDVRFVAGLDTPSGVGSTAGILESEKEQTRRYVGHLGYTGCSFWIRLEDGGRPEGFSGCVLLTNRTASRRWLRSSPATRVLVESDTNGNVRRCRCRVGRSDWEEMAAEDVRELVMTERRASTIVWNQSDLRKPPLINDTRRFVAESTWISGGFSR